MYIERKSATKDIEIEPSTSDIHVDKPIIPPEVRRKKTRGKTFAISNDDIEINHDANIVKFDINIINYISCMNKWIYIFETETE